MSGPARRLRWWTELLLIGALYGAYSFGRLLARGDVSTALDHGKRILHVERVLRLDMERALNGLLTHSTAVGVACDFAYAALHYLVTPAVLLWMWHRRQKHYSAVRTWLAISTVLGLVGFTLMPTAPPRLLERSYGFVDSMAQYASFGWWGSEASAPRGLGGMTNQYAAMPSLHVGWALWCGVLLWRYGRSPAVRVLGVLYPLVITFVVMATANHYLLDAVAGAAVMGIGALLARPAMRLADRLRSTWDACRGGNAAGDGPSRHGTAAVIPLQSHRRVPGPRQEPALDPDLGTGIEPGSAVGS
ncbi:phosphatase PAP2 family protein [Wenjunlia tyrosinilytica]|uniref:phosphatase PAP2 family protein n=1 Tax=Wenjunlia tyrosinilytica TaxID=1544741 RepID=UPI001666A8BD|nr:phosphatase PAP2 family protein [Wenjunlia tyrosinilytica]